MSVNPFEYLSISKGTINLGGSKEKTFGDTEAAKEEDKKTTSSSTSEDNYVETDILDDMQDNLEMMREQSEQITDAITNLLKSNITAAQQSQAAPASASQTSNASITPVSGDFANKLNQKFKGALANKGDVIVGAAQKYGLDPALLAAIMALETGWGTSSAVKNQNNPGGLMSASSNWMKLQSFSTIEEGIDAMAKNLKKGYIDKGLTTIAQIGNKYCPVGAANDPNGTNSGWIPSVTSIYNQLKA